jgi:fumarate reductase subunit C
MALLQIRFHFAPASCIRLDTKPLMFEQYISFHVLLGPVLIVYAIIWFKAFLIHSSTLYHSLKNEMVQCLSGSAPRILANRQPIVYIPRTLQALPALLLAAMA